MLAALPEPNDAAVDEPTSATDNSGQVFMSNKIHLRGVDVLTTEDIKSYASEHFGTADRIEWIDDTAANLVFSSEGAAQDALVALSAVPVADPMQLPPLECFPAKRFSSKPDVSLQVRVAVSSDKKQVGAASRSRFYLLHPEYDPEERRRREQQTNRLRYRSRDRRHRRGSQGRGRDRYEEEEDVAFDASFYDDPEPDQRRSPLGDSRRSMRSPDSRSSRQHNAAKELFPSRRRDSRLRDRSASPPREHAVNDNRARAQRVKSQLSANNGAKELFPSKVGTPNLTQLDRLDLKGEPGTSDGTLSIRGLASKGKEDDGFALKGASTARVKELFPDKFGDNGGKELFEDRLEGRGKRRRKAEDLFR